MESRFAQIDISTTPSQLSIEQPQAQMDLQQPKAEIVMQTIPGQLTIDQSRAWEAMDIKHIFRRVEENAQKANNDVLNGIGRTAAEGDELMRIENGGSPIANQATRNSQLLNYDYNIGFVPPPFSVVTNYQPGKVNIQVETRPVINHSEARKPIIDYRQGQVDISMKQYPELYIDLSV